MCLLGAFWAREAGKPQFSPGISILRSSVTGSPRAGVHGVGKHPYLPMPWSPNLDRPSVGLSHSWGARAKQEFGPAVKGCQHFRKELENPRLGGVAEQGGVGKRAAVCVQGTSRLPEVKSKQGLPNTS